MPEGALLQILDRLRASRFAELRGARLTAAVPVSGRLLTELAGALLPPSLPLRDLQLQPQPGDRIRVRARLARVDFLPPLNITAAIERQPELPDGPLVLRLLTFPGLISLLGAALPLSSKLPPGVRLDGDRVYVDLKTLAERQGHGELLPLVTGVRLTTGDDTLVVELEVRV